MALHHSPQINQGQGLFHWGTVDTLWTFKTYKIDPLSKFQAYNTVLRAIVTMVRIGSLDLVHFLKIFLSVDHLKTLY